jgi:hypothetical protein
MDFLGEVQHALEAGQRLLALVVVVAEADAELVGDRPLLDAADEQVDVFSRQNLASSSGFESSTMTVPSSHSSAQLLVVRGLPVCEPTSAVFMPSVRRALTSENALKAPPTRRSPAFCPCRLPVAAELGDAANLHRSPDPARAFHDRGSPENTGHVVERLGGVLDAEEGNRWNGMP